MLYFFNSLYENYEYKIINIHNYTYRFNYKRLLSMSYISHALIRKTTYKQLLNYLLKS
jgi:hypothetical protein